MILSILFILSITFGIGLPLVLIITPKANPFIKLGLSYPLGIGIFTLLMFGTNLLGLKFTLLNELLLLLFVSTPFLLTQLKKIKLLFKDIKENIKNTKFDLAEKITLGILAFLIVVSFINTFYWPPYMWDSVVLYDYRGHVFAITGFMKDVFINPYYYSYPLLTSLAHTIVYLCGGKYPQFIYSIFYLSLGVSFYGLLKEFVSRKVSLFATTLLLMTGPLFYHSLYSYTNLTYTVYLSLGAILIYLWSRKGNIGYLVLSAILIGLSTCVRSSEPFWLVILVAIFLILIFLKKLKYILFYTPIVVLIRQSWIVYQHYLMDNTISITSNVTSYQNLLLSLSDVHLWGQIIAYLYKYVVVPWGAIFIVFVLSSMIVLFKGKARRLYWIIFFIVGVLLISLIIGTFGLSIAVDFWNRIGDAAERLSMLFYPFFVYCIALTLSYINKDSIQKEK